MSIIQGTAKSSGATSFYDFPIENSLRFDGTSSYLSRTFGSGGSTTTWTFSCWIKRSVLSSAQVVFGTQLDGSSIGFISFENDKLRVNNKNNQSTGDASDTNMLFRDTSSFYSIVVVFEGNQSTQSDRTKFYINGILQSRTTVEIHSSGSGYCNGSSLEHRIGDRGGGQPSQYFNGYLANIQFIDGQALDPYFFGEFKDNIWVPYNAFSTAGSGTATASDGDTATDSYGTNGFHLTFEDGIESLPVGGYTGNQNAFRDKSHNTNHWKIN